MKKDVLKAKLDKTLHAYLFNNSFACNVIYKWNKDYPKEERTETDYGPEGLGKGHAGNIVVNDVENIG